MSVMPLPIPSTRTIALILGVATPSAAPALRPIGAQQTASAPTKLRFGISFPLARSAEPLDGRMILVISNNDRREPRFENDVYEADTQLAFGIDVDSLRPGQEAYVDASTFGYPLKSIGDIPAGDYWVQAVLNKYTTFHRGDGHVVKLHMDQGEGQHWNTSPGNLFNRPVRVHVDPASDAVIHLSLDQEIPPLPQPHDTKYVKYVRIQSPLLTKFWGRPMYLGAIVLLPEGFDQHPNARYPLMINHGHFEAELRNFRETPSPDAKGSDAAYEFYKQWTSPRFPRMLMVVVQHANPFYDDSYAVNSVNNGPYQDALLTELVPVLEKQFRLIPEANARFLTGGSTGGWECAALQLQRPDFFGGAWCLYPDPVDFHRNQLVDNYADTNAFVPNTGTAPWPERYMSRTEEGQPLLSERMMSRLEEVRGTKARSGEQFDAWDAAYGPVGADGYPRRLWNRLTGVIDKDVAAYWPDHGDDLTWNLRQNWTRIGPSLTGKMHVYVGDMDNYYLNLGVYLMEQETAKLDNPKANFTFEYGRPMKPHGWQPFTNAELVRMMDRFRRSRMTTS